MHHIYTLFLWLIQVVVVGTDSWPMAGRTSSAPLNVSGSHWIPLTSSLDHGSGGTGGTGGNGGSSGGNGVDGDSPRYDRRKREDDTLYVICLLYTSDAADE